MNNEEVVYSFSRLKLFNECRQAYYLTYILKADKRVNIYSEIGTEIHEILENIQSGKDIDVEKRVEMFEDKVDECEIFGIEFVNDNIKNKYIENINHCLRNFKPLQGVKFEVEKEISLELEGYKLTGFIDLIIHNEDGTVSIIDFKTSSKYAKKDLEKNANQLILYGLALEELGYVVRDIKWMMLKYCMVQGKRTKKMIERRELEDGQEFEDAFVEYPYNEVTKMYCKSWVLETIEEIESLTQYDTWEAKEVNKGTSFYCTNICSVCNKCQALKEYQMKYKG